MDWLFLSIYFGNLLNYIDRGAISTLLPELHHEFHLSKLEQGVLGSTFMIGYVFSCVIFSYLASFYNRQRLLVAGCTLWLTSTMIMAFASKSWHLYFARSLSGIGEASYQSIVPILLNDIYGEARGWRRTSIFFTAINIGLSFGLLFGGAIRPWRWIYGFEFVFGLVFLGILAKSQIPTHGNDDIRSMIGETDKSTAIRSEWEKVCTIFRTPEWWYATLGNMSLTYATGALSLWMPTFYKNEYGHQIKYSNITAALSMSLLVSGTLGSYLGDRLPKRLCGRDFERRDRLMSMCLVATLLTIPFSVSAVAIPMSFQASIILFSISLVIFAFLNIPNSMMTVITVPKDTRSYSTSLCILILHLGGDMPSPIVSSLIWDKTHDLRKALSLSLCSLAVATLIYISGYRYSRRKLPILMGQLSESLSKGILDNTDDLVNL